MNNDDLRNQVDIADSFLNTLSRTSRRYRNIKDPVLRHSMLLDKFLLLTDFLGGFVETKIATMCEQIRLSGFIRPRDDLKQRTDQVMNEMRQELEDLAEWVMHPCYAPDHPYGTMVKDACADTFAAGARRQSVGSNAGGGGFGSNLGSNPGEDTKRQRAPTRRQQHGSLDEHDDHKSDDGAK